MHRRLILFGAGSLTALLVAWQAAPAIQNAVDPATETTAPAKPEVSKPKTTLNAPAKLTPKPVPSASKSDTPMAERVATIGLLNKRNGLWRDLVMKPGEAVHIGDVVVRLKACDKTAPWEPETYTGAFVQLIVNGSDDKWRKVFSGWLFKESPSLNVVEHPIYDVWVKACTMRHPDTGPDTLVVRGGSSESTSGARPASKAKKSGTASPAPVEDSADDNSAI